MIDGKPINEFKADLTRFAKMIDVSFATAFKKIVFEAFTRIVMRSPVDTGRFRSSWTIQEATPNEQVQSEGHYTSPPTPQLELTTPYTIVWINNSLPYAERLEFGWSKQAPAGMVRLTAAEIVQYINRLTETGMST